MNCIKQIVWGFDIFKAMLTLCLKFYAMVDSNKELVYNLEQKVDLLMQRFQALKVENTKLKNENLTLTGQLADALLQQTEIHNRYDNLKLAKTIEFTQVDAHEAKLKINQMVREIDKCIALLNR